MGNPGGPTAKQLCPVLFLVSFCSLALEVILIRAFSIIFWHHLIFIIISIAMLGYGASGTLLVFFPAGRRRPRDMLFWLLAPFPVIVAGSVWAAHHFPFDPVTLLWDPMSLFRLSILYLILALPFANAGLIMSLGYTLRPERAPTLYLFDLLGGSAGAVMGPFLFAASGGRGPALIVLVSSFLPLLSPGVRILRRAPVVVLLLAVLQPLTWTRDAFVPYPNPYKGLPQALLYRDSAVMATAYDISTRVDIVRSPAAIGAPGLSLKYGGDPAGKIGVSIDGGNLTTIYPGGPGTTAVHRYVTTNLPYELSPRGSVLLEDSRGGLDLLAAVDHGATRIVSAEPHPLAHELLDKSLPPFREWAGRKNIEITTGWARNYLARTGQKFDLISLSLINQAGVSSTGLLPAMEDYRFTREALRLYIDHLEDEGVLSLTAYLLPPPRMEGRLMATAVEIMEEKAGAGYERHLFCCRSFNTLSIFLKKTPFTAEETGKALDFCREMGFDVVYYHGITPDETNRVNVFPEPIYEDLLESLLDGPARREIYREGVFDLRPVDDDRPFFFGFMRFGTLAESIRELGGRVLAVLQSGMLIWFIVAQAAVVGLAVMVLPLLVTLRKKRRGMTPIMLYFSMIGSAYMFIEITWIQKFSLITGRPSVTASLVIAIFLLSSGLGSIVIGRLPVRGMPLFIFPLFAGVAAGVSTFVVEELISGVSPIIVSHPLVAAVILALPAAFMMGAPFPLAIRRIRGVSDRLVPWAWAINGCFSVLGAVAAPAIASIAGYSMTALGGAVLYLLAASIFARVH